MVFAPSRGSRPPESNSPSNYIAAVPVARDGTPWISTLKGLASWKDGKLTQYPEVAGQVGPLLQDREGTVWFGMIAPGRLCAILAGEALRNAFWHAQARRIEVEIHYDPSDLRLRIRDDGRGIAREVVEADGRTGHWGLHGMRERAKIIGGNLEVWSSA